MLFYPMLWNPDQLAVDLYSVMEVLLISYDCKLAKPRMLFISYDNQRSFFQYWPAFNQTCLCCIFDHRVFACWRRLVATNVADTLGEVQFSRTRWTMSLELSQAIVSAFL